MTRLYKDVQANLNLSGVHANLWGILCPGPFLCNIQLRCVDLN